MIVVGVLLCLFLGFGMLRLWPLRSNMSFLEECCLAWGIGIGCVAQLTFFALWPFGQLVPEMVCALTVLAVAAVWTVACHRKMARSFSRPDVLEFLVIFLVMLCAVFFCYEAIHTPYGDYDAWSLWNYRAASVFRGGSHWTAVFHNSVQGAHPWLLPLAVVWGWSWSGQETTLVPAVIAVLTAVATVGLLISALARDIGWGRALLAGFFLVSIPFFAWHSISQYASIFVAYYALAACVCLKRLSDGDGALWAFLSALCLGFLASSKDEGIVLAGAIFVGAYLFLKGVRPGISRVFVLTLTVSLAAFFSCQVLMRSGLMPFPMVKSSYYDIDLSSAFSPERWKTIAAFVWNHLMLRAEFGRLHWWLWLVLIGLWSSLGRMILFSVGVYAAFFFFLYLVVARDLIWRLNVTVDRLLFLIYPLLVFVVFYAIFTFKTQRR